MVGREDKTRGPFSLSPSSNCLGRPGARPKRGSNRRGAVGAKRVATSAWQRREILHLAVATFVSPTLWTAAGIGARPRSSGEKNGRNVARSVPSGLFLHDRAQPERLRQTRRSREVASVGSMDALSIDMNSRPSDGRGTGRVGPSRHVRSKCR